MVTRINTKQLKRIVEDPTLVERIRVANGLSQHQLAKLAECSQGTVWAVEAGHRKKVPINIAKKLIELSVSMIRLPPRNEVKFLSAKIAQRGLFTKGKVKEIASRGGYKGAIITATRRELTSQEKLIKTFLESKKIAFAYQALLWGKTRRFIVDFALPSESSPKAIIEAKSLLNKFRKDLQMISLAWRIIKIKQKYPDMVAIVWLEGEIPKSALQIVKDEADYVGVNEPIEKLSEIVGKVTKYRSQI